MIVLSTADLERAAKLSAYYEQNAGRRASRSSARTSRSRSYDEFVAKVSEKVRALRVATEGPGRRVGAITFPPQLQKTKTT